MIRFKSIQKLKKASLQEIQEEIGQAKANLVFEYLNS
jgi:excinuclease UvrABC nuclease subunit